MLDRNQNLNENFLEVDDELQMQITDLIVLVLWETRVAELWAKLKRCKKAMEKSA